MKFRFRILPFITLLLVLALIATSVALVRTKNVYAAKTDKYQNLDLFTNALYLIENDYVEPVDNKKLIYGAIKGMAEELDPHSVFMDPKTLKEFEVETQGEFGGLGITIGMKDKVLTVISPLEDTPAYKKGIKAGDQIVKIDGASTRNITIDDAVNKLRGPAGTDVTITIHRNSVDKPFDVKIKRAIIVIKSIKSSMIDGNIGYIRMIQFTNDISGQLKDAMKALDKKGAKCYVLDLRNNPGGLLTEAINVSSIFLQADKNVVYTMDRNQKRQDYNSTAYSYKELKKPLVLLVNEGSASASEIFTGAMQDYGRATIVGNKTYGKASVQNVMHLPDGSGLKLTIAKYFTPKGRGINGIGIEPDIKVELPKKDEKEEKAEAESAEAIDENATSNSAVAKYDLVKDIQLKAAVDKVKELMGNATAKNKFFGSLSARDKKKLIITISAAVVTALIASALILSFINKGGQQAQTEAPAIEKRVTEVDRPAASKPQENKVADQKDVMNAIALSLFDHGLNNSSIKENTMKEADGRTQLHLVLDKKNADMDSLKTSITNNLEDIGVKTFEGENITGENEKVSLVIEFTQPVKPRETASETPAPAVTGDFSGLKVAFVIDDCGYSVPLAEKLSSVKYPLAMAIIPYTPHSKETAEIVRKHGKAVFLHQPMQPKAYPSIDPGKGAVLLNMPESLVDIWLTNNVADLGGKIDGFNNHMGSAITESKDKMDQIFTVMKRYTDFYVDSYTTAASVAYDECRKDGLLCAQNRKFIDNESDPAYIRGKIMDGLKFGKTKGQIIMIGHLRDNTVDVLVKMLPQIAAMGADIVPVRELAVR